MFECAHGDVGGSGAARRRRDRRLRLHWRHEQLSLRMLRASMGHHSWQSQTSVGVQTDDGMPALSVTYVVPSQQLPPVYSTTTVTTDSVYPQISSTAVEPVAPRVVVSLPPVEEFSAPVYDQVHQELVASCETTEKFAEIPVVHEQVIVQDIPEGFVPLPPAEEFSAPLYDQVHQELVASSEMTETIAEIPVVHEQVIVGTRPERLVDARGPQGGLERAACPRSEAPLLSPVVIVQETAHDDITAAFLLTQSLRQRQEERWLTQRWGEWRMWKRTSRCLSTSVRIACSWRCGTTSGSLGATAMPRCCGTPMERFASGSGRMSSSSLMTTSRELVILDSCFDLFEAEASVFGCGRTPTSRMDPANTSTRCGLRRRSWAAGSMTSGRLRGEGLGIPSHHLGCHGGNVDFFSRPLYLAVNCSVSLVSEHTYVDFWEMIPGFVSALYLFGSGYTHGVSPRGYGLQFTFFLCRWFLGDDFRIVSVFSAQLGSLMDTCTASVYEAPCRQARP